MGGETTEKRQEAVTDEQVENIEDAGELQQEQGEELPQDAAPEPKQEAQEGGIDKALKDTKSYATRLAQENSELKKRLNEIELKFRAGETEEFTALRNQVYQDYPELKSIIEPIIKELSDIKSMRAAEAERLQRNEALEYFNTNVRPVVLRAHPDFDSVLFNEKGAANDEYFQWAAKQRPSLRTAAMDSTDPEDIIWAVTEFKKFKASPEAKMIKEQQTEKRIQRLVSAQTLRGGNTPIPLSGEPQSDDNISVDEWMSRRNKQIHQK